MEAESLKGISRAAPSIDQSYQTEINYFYHLSTILTANILLKKKKKIKLTISYNHRQD